VRVGPFATRAEAERAAAKVKVAGLPAAILSL
jgi:DedD protein